MTESAAPAAANLPASAPTFDVLPLGPDVRRAIDAMGYKHPTPVQTAVFEPACEGKNLVVQARTGTGKTAAFGLPLIDRLVRTSVKSVQALILCPTRELALQVSRELEQIGQFRGTQVTAIYGGAPMGRQVEALQGGAQIVVGTPGRVLDHLRQNTLDPSGIKTLVLDEADEMLSMGFARELNAIIETLPKNRQGLFFSATIPADIERLAHSHLRETELVTLSSDQVGALEISHYVYLLQSGDKLSQLVKILEVEDPESAVIFCNTRDETQRVAEALKTRGFDADWLNGDLPQSDRERVMSATREGRLRFLVATDVAARGIDISHLTHVINHDFPETAEQYVHRTGRTGRAGRTGTAISIIGPKDIGNLYLLRLTYKIRPIEKQLPSAGEVKTRAEMDILQLFVEAFASRPPHPDDVSLARRLLTHDDAERIVAGLLRDHLGARGGDVVAAASEKRRARNPEPQPAPAAAPAAAPAEPAREVPRDGAARRKPEPRARERIERHVLAAAAEAPPTRESGSALPGFTVDEAKGAGPSREAPGFLELFVNIGRREGVHTADLQQLLTGKGIAEGDMGGIRVRDRMTFISVKKEALERVTAALAGQIIGGRTVVAELARGRG
jgi:ATP-dependent RNA helicase DeaD